MNKKIDTIFIVANINKNKLRIRLCSPMILK